MISNEFNMIFLLSTLNDIQFDNFIDEFILRILDNVVAKLV